MSEKQVVITMRIDALNHVSRLYQQSKPTKNVRTEKKYAKDEFQISQTAKDYQIAKQNVESFDAAQQSWNQEENLKKKRQQQG